MHWNRFNMSVHKKEGLENKVERKKMQTEKERSSCNCFWLLQNLIFLKFKTYKTVIPNEWRKNNLSHITIIKAVVVWT